MRRLRAIRVDFVGSAALSVSVSFVLTFAVPISSQEVSGKTVKPDFSSEEDANGQEERRTDLEELQIRLERAEQKLVEADTRSRQKEEELQTQIDDLVTKMEAEELEELLEQSMVEDDQDRLLQIYGFFDVNLYYYQIDDDTPANSLFPEYLSFALGRLHLYLRSQMTETLSTLAEFRYTALPHGHEESYNFELLGTEYQRENTTVLDPFTAEEYPLGGLGIERAHLTYSPRDWFNVIAGKYLTPFGIWNVDHGSPVLIPVRPPYFMNRHLVPLSQTGIQIFGRFFLNQKTFVDYAITLSNGRGSTETLYDLDANKAVGLRLRGVYEGDDFNLSTGGYLYYGDTTDIVKNITLENNRITMVTDVVENYTEFNGTLDILLEIFNLRIQAEYLRGIVRYDERPPKLYPVLNIPTINGELQSDHIKWAIYGLVAYDFLFQMWEAEMRITPFAMYEYCVFDDSKPDYITAFYRGGLNFSPAPYLSIKYESGLIQVPKFDIIDDLWLHSFQLAVSF